MKSHTSHSPVAPNAAFARRSARRIVVAMTWAVLGVAAHAEPADPCRVDARQALRVRPCPVAAQAARPTAAVRSAAAPASAAAAAPMAKAATPPGSRKRLAELLRERDGAASPNVSPGPPPTAIEGASILPDRMGAV